MSNRKNGAQTFLYLCLGVLALALAYNLVATPVVAGSKNKQQPNEDAGTKLVGISTTNNGWVFAIDNDGNLYSAYQASGKRVLRRWGNLLTDSKPMLAPLD